MSLPPVIRPIQRSQRGGKLWPVMFRSRLLDLRCNLFVYTPPGADRAADRLARLPVLYLLHGMWGSEIDWPFKGDAQTILDREILAGRVRPMLVAMPHDGLADDGTFYSNWHSPPGRPALFEDYLVQEVRPFVEVELAGRLRGRGERCIAGLSMGGFGALTLALRHRELFAAAGSMSGAVRPIGHPRLPELGQRIFGPFDGGPDSHRRRHDPSRLVELAGQPVALYLDCGRADGLLAMNRKLHARLERLGIPHRYVEYAGRHDWPSWRKRLGHALRFLSASLPG